jgi:hypothetical protein
MIHSDSLSLRVNSIIVCFIAPSQLLCFILSVIVLLNESFSLIMILLSMQVDSLTDLMQLIHYLTINNFYCFDQAININHEDLYYLLLVIILFLNE